MTSRKTKVSQLAQQSEDSEEEEDFNLVACHAKKNQENRVHC
jgi:hypothetical protein